MLKNKEKMIKLKMKYMKMIRIDKKKKEFLVIEFNDKSFNQ